MYLQCWHGGCHVKLLPSQHVLCIWLPYNHAPCHFMQSHIVRVHACLVVTCHLHFWQNDPDLLHATAVTWGWNGHRNKSQHRKLTQEKKILLLFLEPETFRSWVQHPNHWAIPTPHKIKYRERKGYLTMVDEGSCSCYIKNKEMLCFSFTHEVLQ